MKILYIFAVVLAVESCYAQGEQKEYLKTVNEFCPDADIIDREMKEDFMEIDLLCDGKLYEIGLNRKKEIIFIETEADPDQMPLDDIHDKLNKRYYGWKLDEYSYIELPDTAFYKVEILKNGVEENIYFTLDGKYYKSGNIAVNESWDLDKLSQSTAYRKAPYDFLDPDKTYHMPDVLKEISGVVWVDENLLYAIQDEDGIVFKYDTQQEAVIGILRFTDDGDFEDVAVQEDIVYVLRSDGTVFYFNHRHFNGIVDQIVVPLGCSDIEGLFYNPDEQLMYMACKDELVGAYSSRRNIFVFSPDSMYNPRNAFTIKMDNINQLVEQQFPELGEEKFHFNPSAIAIHPFTGEKYVLSADNRLMAIYNNHGLINVYPLPAELYYKPEGLAFNPDGDLYISSEGIKKGYTSGQILYFEWNE